MTLLLSDVEVRQILDPRALALGIESALKAEAVGHAVVPQRMNLEYMETWLRVMPAILPSEGVMGLKVFHGVSGSGVRYLILLYDMSDGVVLAAVDGSYLTAARTAATSAIAGKHLLPQGALKLGVLGSGTEAEAHCEALCALTSVTAVSVYSPNERRRSAFAERMESSLGIPFTPCDRPEAALDGADHVVIATNTGPSMNISCRAEWLRPGQHVSAIGSTNVNLRELETDVFRKADVIVVDADPKQLAEESGDIIQYCAEGGDLSNAPLLSWLVSGNARGREDQRQLTLFKSVGTSLQDVAAANVIYRGALDLGLGRTVPTLSQEKWSSAQCDEALAETNEALVR